MTHPTFDAAVGANIARLRTSAGKTQARLAEELATHGISWRRSTVAQVETGRRAVSLPEALALADELEVPLAKLLDFEVPVTVDSGGVWHPNYVKAALAGTTQRLPLAETYTSPAQGRLDSQIRTALLAVDAMRDAHKARWPGRSHSRDVRAATDLDENAAQRLEATLRLGVRAWDVRAASDELWGRSLEAERDERVRLRSGANPSPRSLQAIRGLVTRQLDKELSEAIEQAADRAAGKGNQ